MRNTIPEIELRRSVTFLPSVFYVVTIEHESVSVLFTSLAAAITPEQESPWQILVFTGDDIYEHPYARRYTSPCANDAYDVAHDFLTAKSRYTKL